MKNFKISLNPLDKGSVKAAIKEIEKMQKVDWFQEFVKASCEWIIARANFYLDATDLPADIKNDIKSLWNKPLIIGNKMAILSNGSDDRARFKRDYFLGDEATDINVLIEFGVGIEGAGTHPMANQQGLGADYLYNIKPKHKLADDSWIFRIGDKSIDIQEKYILSDRSEHPNTIRTKGQPAVMYFHKAVVDYVNGGYQNIKI